LATLRLRRVEQFEDRASAEKVKIDCIIRMMRVQEFRSSRTFPRPFVVEPVQSSLVKPDGTPRCIPQPQDTVMNHAAEKKSHDDACESRSNQYGEHPPKAQSQHQQNRCKQ
jgi:hypothetical protein